MWLKRSEAIFRFLKRKRNNFTKNTHRCAKNLIGSMEFSPSANKLFKLESVNEKIENNWYNRGKTPLHRNEKFCEKKSPIKHDRSYSSSDCNRFTVIVGR